MGSGRCGRYANTYGAKNCSHENIKRGSQPYSESYHVDPVMHQQDVVHGIYHDGHYDKNPTAKNIVDMINGNYIVDKSFNDDNMPYVVDLEGNIITGKRNGNGKRGMRTPHPTLIGGKDPMVKMAGILKIRNGKIIAYDNQSGHYKPNIKSMKFAKEAFGKLPSYLFAKEFKEGHN